ncbi:MAG: hypothetical protein IKK24_06885, partial [Clostridia bacterium]|nr:hypothetical protein [Clostridia bacterium]
MKFLKKAAITLFSVIIATSSMFLTVSAAASSSISLSKGSVKIGESITVTVSVRADAEMYALEGYVDYNADVLQFDSGNSAAPDAAGTVKIVGTPGGDKSQSYTLKFTAIATGESGIKFRDGVYVGDKEVSVKGSSVRVSVIDNKKSDNADLSSLKLSTGSLSPKFNSQTTNYTALVANSVTSCPIY